MGRELQEENQRVVDAIVQELRGFIAQTVGNRSNGEGEDGGGESGGGRRGRAADGGGEPGGG